MTEGGTRSETSTPDFDFDVWIIFDRASHHLEAFFNAETALLLRIDREEKDDFIENLEAALQDVEVTIGDWVE